MGLSFGKALPTERIEGVGILYGMQLYRLDLFRLRLPARVESEHGPLRRQELLEKCGDAPPTVLSRPAKFKSSDAPRCVSGLLSPYAPSAGIPSQKGHEYRMTTSMASSLAGRLIGVDRMHSMSTPSSNTERSGSCSCASLARSSCASRQTVVSTTETSLRALMRLIEMSAACRAADTCWVRPLSSMNSNTDRISSVE
eukprot:1524391-Prymnesium_polylepis.1